MDSQESRSEGGQAIVMMALGMIVLLAFLALAIDGGRVYTEERSAQNAADHAAMAAARAACQSQDASSAGLAWASTNGYDNNGTTNWVQITGGTSFTQQALITKTVSSTLAQIAFRNPLQLTVKATAQCLSTDVIFAGSQTCNNGLNITGSTGTINGGVHSNDQTSIGGGGNDIWVNGMVTYVDSYSLNPSKVHLNPSTNNPLQVIPENYPVSFNMADFQPGGHYASLAGSKYYTPTTMDFSKATKSDKEKCTKDGINTDITDGCLAAAGLLNIYTSQLQDGLYYTGGKIALGSTITGTQVTFASLGDITMNGPYLGFGSFVNDPTYGRLFAFSTSGGGACTHTSIGLTPARADLTGIVFAPNGRIDVGISTVNLVGKMIGNTVNIHGSGLSISDPDNTFRLELVK